jgi:hypothetical protein
MALRATATRRLNIGGPGIPGCLCCRLGARSGRAQALQRFSPVLLAMPRDDFERFFALDPTIVCQPALEGAAYSYSIRCGLGRRKRFVFV